MKKLLMVSIVLFISLLSNACSASGPAIYQWVDSSSTCRFEVDVNNVYRSSYNHEVIAFQDKVINYQDGYIAYGLIVANMQNHEFSINVQIFHDGEFVRQISKEHLIYTSGSYFEEEVIFASHYVHTGDR